jgi:hypothetical protein
MGILGSQGRPSVTSWFGMPIATHIFLNDVADILAAVPAKSYDSGLSRISSSSARIRGAR